MISMMTTPESVIEYDKMPFGLLEEPLESSVMTADRNSNRLRFLDKIPYAVLILFAGFMLLAPFRPMPHVMEKTLMLLEGTLTRPIDIFDLFYHLVPAMLLFLKILRDIKK